MQSMTTKDQIKHALLNTTAKQVASCVLHEYCKKCQGLLHFYAIYKSAYCECMKINSTLF